jgi:hypothetical protein
MAPDFVVEGSHRLALDFEIEIDVEFTGLAYIAPDCGRRRLRPLARLTQHSREVGWIEPDQPIEPGRRCGGFRCGRRFRQPSHRWNRGRRLVRWGRRCNGGSRGHFSRSTRSECERERVAPCKGQRQARHRQDHRSSPHQVYRSCHCSPFKCLRHHIATNMVNGRLMAREYAIGRLLTISTWFHAWRFYGKV